MNALPVLNDLKRRNDQLGHSHSGRLNLCLCTVFRGGWWGWGWSNLSWMSKVRQTACGGLSTGPADVLLCTASQHTAQAGSENRPVPVCQHTAACRRGGWGVVKSRWKNTDTQVGWSVWTLCVYSMCHSLQNFSFYSFLPLLLWFGCTK